MHNAVRDAKLYKRVTRSTNQWSVGSLASGVYAHARCVRCDVCTSIPLTISHVPQWSVGSLAREHDAHAHAHTPAAPMAFERCLV
eukprot:5210840-Prymnesium_polylepis.1